MTQEPSDAHVDALVAAVRARYGDKIPESEVGRIRESVKGLRAAVLALDAYPLSNADEPSPYFAAYRAEG